MMPVSALLTLRSSEATLACRTGHIAGLPHWCDSGCVLVPGLTIVADILAYKQLHAVDMTQPLQVEDGWLIDGHHRTLVALDSGRIELPVRYVTGVLTKQRAFHASIARQCRQL